MVRNICVLPSTRRPAHPELTPQRPDPHEPPRLRTTRHRFFEQVTRLPTKKHRCLKQKKSSEQNCFKTHVFFYRKLMGERRRLHGSDATRTIRDACAQLLHAKVQEPDQAGHKFFQKGKSADILPSQKSCRNNCI